MNHSESKHIFEMELRLEFQAAVCLSGNALVQEAVDISIVAFIWSWEKEDQLWVEKLLSAILFQYQSGQLPHDYR